ncbi:MAG: flippase-like domain-containing protein [Magnetococcales bacterium]|nr:flippase-like domain-containing protein [Magnetococcales bacterium]
MDTQSLRSFSNAATFVRRAAELSMKPATRLIIAAGLIAILFHGEVIDFSTLEQLITHPLVILQVVAIVLLALVLSGLRWFLLLACQGIHVSAIKSIQILFITVFFSMFLPGGFLTSDALRTAYVAREAPDQRTAATWSIFFDRLIGIYALFLLCLVFSLFNRDAIVQHVPLLVLTVSAAGISLGMPLALFLFMHFSHTSWGQWILTHSRSQQVRWTLDRLVHAVDLYKKTPGSMAMVLFLALFNHILTIACILAIVASSGIGALTHGDYVLATLWSTAANALPITPGGLGVGEGSFDQIARLLETIPSATGYGTIFLVFRILSSLALLPGLFFYLVYRRDIRETLQSTALPST